MDVAADLTCRVCLQLYDGGQRQPWDLGCGHLLCGQCYERLRARGSAQCPFDRRPWRSPHVRIDVRALAERWQQTRSARPSCQQPPSSCSSVPQAPGSNPGAGGGGGGARGTASAVGRDWRDCVRGLWHCVTDDLPEQLVRAVGFPPQPSAAATASPDNPSTSSTSGSSGGDRHGGGGARAAAVVRSAARVLMCGTGALLAIHFWRLFLASLLMLLPAAVCLVAGPAAFARLGPQEGEFPLPRDFLIYASLTFAGAASLWLILGALWALGLTQQVLVAVLATAAVLSTFHTCVHGCNSAIGHTCRRRSWLLAGCTVLAAGVMCACWSDSVAGAFNILSWPLIRLLRLLATPVVTAAQSIAALVADVFNLLAIMAAAADKSSAEFVAAAFTSFRLLTLHANAAAAAAVEAVTGTAAAVVTAWCNTTEDASRGGPMELLQLLVLLPARTMMPLTVCAVSTVLIAPNLLRALLPGAACLPQDAPLGSSFHHAASAAVARLALSVSLGAVFSVRVALAANAALLTAGHLFHAARLGARCVQWLRSPTRRTATPPPPSSAAAAASGGGGLSLAMLDDLLCAAVGLLWSQALLVLPPWAGAVAWLDGALGPLLGQVARLLRLSRMVTGLALALNASRLLLSGAAREQLLAGYRAHRARLAAEGGYVLSVAGAVAAVCLDASGAVAAVCLDAAGAVTAVCLLLLVLPPRQTALAERLVLWGGAAELVLQLLAAGVRQYAMQLKAYGMQIRQYAVQLRQYGGMQIRQYAVQLRQYGMQIRQYLTQLGQGQHGMQAR